jgi:hypothetical protein
MSLYNRHRVFTVRVREATEQQLHALCCVHQGMLTGEACKELACSVQVWVPSMASVRGDSGEKLIAVASTKVWPHIHKGQTDACRGNACFCHDKNIGFRLLTCHHPLCKLRADCALGTRSSHSMQRSCEGESRHCLYHGRTSTLQ